MGSFPPAALELARQQHGVIHRDQLRLLGISKDKLYRRREAGLLTPLTGGSFLIGGAPQSPEALYVASTLAINGAVLSHDAAAFVHRIPGFRAGKPHIITAIERNTKISNTHGSNVVVHRRNDLLPGHVTEVRGIPITTLSRTLLDVAAHHGATQMRRALDDLHENKRLPLRTLIDDFNTIARRGRNGTTLMRELLDERVNELGLSQSVLEQRGVAFLRRSGFSGYTLEFAPPWSGPALARVDVAFPTEAVVVEFDGRKWHDRTGAFENDRYRDQLAADHGWLVFRITWKQLHHEPTAVAKRLHNTLARRS